MYTASIVFRSGHTGLYTLPDDYDPALVVSQLGSFKDTDWIAARLDPEHFAIEAWVAIHINSIASIVIHPGAPVAPLPTSPPQDTPSDNDV